MSEIGKTYAITAARLVLGGTALMYGISATFGAFGGANLGEAASEAAAQTSAPPSLVVNLISIGLLLCGLALILGVFVRVAAALVLVVVIFDAVANSRFSAFFVANQGCEHVLALSALCVVIAAYGPGAAKINLKRKKK